MIIVWLVFFYCFTFFIDLLPPASSLKISLNNNKKGCNVTIFHSMVHILIQVPQYEMELFPLSHVPLFNKIALKGLGLRLSVNVEFFIPEESQHHCHKLKYIHILTKKYRNSSVHQCIFAALITSCLVFNFCIPITCYWKGKFTRPSHKQKFFAFKLQACPS